MASTTDDATLLGELGEILADALHVQYSGPIERGTRFFADLGLASIDAIVLAEALQARSTRTLPFGELMEELGSRAERDLPLGELVDFLRKHRDDGGSQGGGRRRDASDRRR